MNDNDDDVWMEVPDDDQGVAYDPLPPTAPPIYETEQVTAEVRTQVCDGKGPYIVHTIQRTIVARSHNPGYNPDQECTCGHPHYRHFDTYEQMAPIGCKYCECWLFTPKE